MGRKTVSEWIPFDQMKKAIINGFMSFMEHTNRDIDSLEYENQSFYDNEVLEDIRLNNKIYDYMLKNANDEN